MPAAGGPMTQDRRVAIIGLGYVGLPLAIAFTEAGLEVLGVDASEERLASIRAHASPVDDVTNERLSAALASGFAVASSTEPQLASVDAVLVCVPTPITPTKDPDLGPVLAASATVARGLRKGQLVILQSTTFPGT